MYHTPCGDVMKNHMKSCNEQNHSLVTDKIFYSFGEDRPSDAPEPVRTDTSPIAETSDDDMPIKSGKQQSSSGKHYSKVSANKSHTGNISSSDHSTSDSGTESPEETPTPVSKAQVGSSKVASVSKSSNKSKCKKKNCKLKHSSKKKKKKCKHSDDEDPWAFKHCKLAH